MKKFGSRVLAALLLGLVLLTTACTGRGNAIQSALTPTPTLTPTLTGNVTDTPVPTAAEDGAGEVSLTDYDPEATYTMPSFFDLNLTEYVTLGRYEGLTVSVARTDITADDDTVEETLEAILEENGKILYTTDRVTAWGDTIVFDYVGTLDGVAFSGGSGSNVTTTISEDANYISDFLNGLVGLTPGVATDVAVTFPENYGSSDLAGKETVFTMTVQYIIEKPELDDALAAELSGKADMTAVAYRQAVRDELEQGYYENAASNALWSAIVENAAVISYPKDAVLYYYDYYYDMYSYYASVYGMTYENFLLASGTSAAYVLEYCKQYVKEDMVRYAVFAAEEYTCTEAEMDATLDNFTENNIELLEENMGKEYTFEEAKAYFAEYLGDNLRSNCINEKATADLLTRNTVTVTD